MLAQCIPLNMNIENCSIADIFSVLDKKAQARLSSLEKALNRVTQDWIEVTTERLVHDVKCKSTQEEASLRIVLMKELLPTLIQDKLGRLGRVLVQGGRK